MISDHLQGTPAILTVPVLSPCLRAEQIHITVDTHTGMLRCHVPKHLNCTVIPELEAALNSDIGKLPQLVSELRFWITQRRCEKTLQHLPATSFELLPLLYAPDPALARTGRHKMFIKLHRHSNIILVSIFFYFLLQNTFIQNRKEKKQFKIDLFLLQICLHRWSK